MNPIIRFLLSAALTICVINLGCRPRSQSQTPSPDNLGASAPSKIQSTLTLEAGLVYKSGDVKPVPRNEFYLLDDDAEKILKDAGIEKKGRLKHWKDVSFFNS